MQWISVFLKARKVFFVFERNTSVHVMNVMYGWSLQHLFIRNCAIIASHRGRWVTKYNSRYYVSYLKVHMRWSERRLGAPGRQKISISIMIWYELWFQFNGHLFNYQNRWQLNKQKYENLFIFAFDSNAEFMHFETFFCYAPDCEHSWKIFSTATKQPWQSCKPSPIAFTII